MKFEKKKVDMRVVKTLHSLNEAFLALLEEEDLEDITVNDLCLRADIRRATFYKHFAGKNAFVDYSIRHMHDKFAEAAAKKNEQTGGMESYYLSYAHQSLRFVGAHEKLMRRLKKTNLLPEFLSAILEEAFEGMKVRLLEEEKRGMSLSAKPEVLASFYTGGLYQVLLWRLSDSCTLTEDELVAEIAAVIKRF